MTDRSKTSSDPWLALSLRARRASGDAPTVGDIASLIGGLTRIFEIAARQSGPLQVDRAHDGNVLALCVAECEGGPLVITGGDDGAVRSWRLDGSPGPLQAPDAHVGAVTSLVTVEDSGGCTVVTGGADGALRSWHLDGSPGPLQAPDAHDAP
jgi:WD40 repeat protein